MSKVRPQVRVKLNPYEVAQKARRMGVTAVVLAFSGGKDSIAGWLALRKAGIKVIPLHRAQYPNLDIEKNVIRFYSHWFKTKIHVILHPFFYGVLKTGSLQDPVTLRICETLEFREHPGNDDLMARWKKKHNLEKYPTVVCIKRSDSAQRMMKIAKTGEISKDLKEIFPMANASDKMALQMIANEKCPLPSFYRDNFESFDTMRITTLDWIRTHAPKDWQKIKEWQPLVETEYVRLTRPLV